MLDFGIEHIGPGRDPETIAGYDSDGNFVNCFDMPAHIERRRPLKTRGRGKNKIYTVPSFFIFQGTIMLKGVASEQEAEQQARSDVGLALGEGLHSSLPEEAVDWDFPMHPERR